MTEILRHYLHYSFHSLTKYDYMAIGWILFLAFLLIVLALLIRKRILAYFLLFLGLFLLFAGPPAIKFVMDGYLRAVKLEIEKIKPLRYSRALIVEGTLQNRGKIDYSSCDLVLSVYRPDTFMKRAAAFFKPSKVKIVHYGRSLERKESKPFRIIVDHFNNRSDFNVTVQARCYP
ncbi:DUF2393 family protein [Hydrogenimonas sp.]